MSDTCLNRWEEDSSWTDLWGSPLTLRDGLHLEGEAGGQLRIWVLVTGGSLSLPTPVIMAGLLN